MILQYYVFFNHSHTQCYEVGLHRSPAPAPARIRHFFQIRLRSKFRQSRMLLPDVKNAHK